jgi:arylsulfatase A-like enzyme
VAPAPYNALYDPDEVPACRRAASPQAEAAQHPYLAWLLAREQASGAVPDGIALRQLRATYYGLIAEVDHHIGRLVDWLKRNGRYEDTLIVFSSDHGEMLGDHWYLGKEGYFDQAYHVPLIVRVPGDGLARGKVVDAFTEGIDLMPTILDLAGLAVPAQCDGSSLVPWLRGAVPAGWRQEAHWEFDFRDVVHGVPEKALGLRLEECCLAVIRGRGTKYVHFAGLPPLFFDLQADPDELDNRAGDPAEALRLLACAQRLLTWRLVHDERTLSGVLLTPAGPIERPAARR